jgi:hypothetical protein
LIVFEEYPIDKTNFYAYITGMLLPGINLIPIVERVVNDAASVIGIAALFYAILKKNHFTVRNLFAVRTPFLKKT